MENDSITTQVTETIQDTSALTTMTESIQKLTTTPVSEWLPDLVKTYLVPLGLKILAAIVVLLLGRWVIKLVKKWMANGLMSRHGDATLHSFLSNLVSVLLYFILIIAIIGILGILPSCIKHNISESSSIVPNPPGKNANTFADMARETFLAKKYSNVMQSVRNGFGNCSCSKVIFNPIVLPPIS